MYIIFFQLINLVTSLKNIILRNYVRRTCLFVANEMSGKRLSVGHACYFVLLLV